MPPDLSALPGVPLAEFLGRKPRLRCLSLVLSWDLAPRLNRELIEPFRVGRRSCSRSSTQDHASSGVWKNNVEF